jgi:zinc protease
VKRASLVTLLLATATAFALPQAAHADTPMPWDKAGIDWTKVPPLGAEVAFVPPRPTRLKLKNGMSLLVVENHRLPLVSMELVVKDAGSAQDPAGKSGLAAFTADLLDEGAGGMGALEIAARVDELGATLQLGTSYDAASVSVSTLTRTLDPTLDLLARIVTTPSFDDKEVARVRDDWQTALERRADVPRQIVALVLRGVVYGAQAAYGRPGDGYLPEFKSLGLADAKQFYAARWTPRAMTLVVVGDVDTKALAARLDAAFAAWKPVGTKAAKIRVAAARAPARLWLVDRPTAEQADVRLGIYGLALADKRYPAAEVLATLLGGSFTSRLNHRLREELGWTYGAGAAFGRAAQVGPFVISTALVTPHAVEGVAEILKIVDSLVGSDLPAAEVAKARSNVIRSLPAQFGTNADTAGSFASLVADGLPDDYFATYVARVQKVTGKDLQKVARELLPSGKLIVVVAGDAGVLRAGLEKLFGPARMMRPDLTDDLTPAEPSAAPVAAPK